MFSEARKAAGIDGVSFGDLRGTAVTRLALAGCTVPEICAITGHSHEDANHWRYRSRRFGVSPGPRQAIDQKALKGAPAHVPHLPKRLRSRPEKTNDFSFLDLPMVRSRGHRP